MIDHVVRRGLQHASTMDIFKRAAEEAPKLEIPKWGVAIIAVTFIASIIFISAVEYTLKDVIVNLSMIETPSAAITVSTPNEPASKDEKEGLLETAPTMTLVTQKPITSSIRGSIRHLVSQAGRLARWRGFRIHALYALALTIVANVVDGLLPTGIPFRMVLISGIGGALCANIHAAWIHKVISVPSDTTFWQRVPSRNSWKVLALPAAISSSMPYISMEIGKLFVTLFKLDKATRDNFAEYTGAQWTILLVRFLAIFVILMSCTLFLCLPAIVTLVRIEASILPEDQDTIVPFDRTFSGKVVPKVLGGTGSIAFLDAWRSFNWEARRRLIKLYVKIFFVISGMIFIVAHVIVFEIFAIMGPAVGKFLAEARQQGFNVKA